MRILLTAFEAYDEWTENSSWLAMIAMLRDFTRPSDLDLVTRRYPVDLTKLQGCLDKDLQQPYDAVLHLGQSPGSNCVRLEAIALNVAGLIEEQGIELNKIIEQAPIAYESTVPVGRWAERLRDEQIPAVVSYHAGTFLCNATLYLTHHRFASSKQAPRIGFVHLPLASEQVIGLRHMRPSLPTSTLARAIQLLVEDLQATHSNTAKRNLA